jgi:hypothetical protein
MTRIFIEDQELDVNQGFTNQLTYSVDDLNNLDSKTTSFSKTIVLPGTNTNNRLLGNIFEVGNANFTVDSDRNLAYNFNASKSAKARIEMDGIQVMKGTLRLLEIIVDGDYIEYEVALFGELGGFVSKLGAKKLTDLNFSAYNHTYNITNIANSWDSANAGQGYYYPLIDYGNVSSPTNPLFSKRNYYFTAFRPALFVREYISKIITDAGYTFESAFFDTDFFKRLIIPNNQTRLQVKRNRIFSASPTSTVDRGNAITLGNQVLGSFTTTDSKTFTYTGATTFNGTINCNFVGSWTLPFEPISGSGIGRFNLYKNGSLYVEGNTAGGIFFNTIPATVGGIGNNYTSESFTMQVSFVATLNTNDTFKINFDTYSGASIVRLSFTGNSVTVDSDKPTFTAITLNETVTVSDTIPANILQKDFFASVIKLFNLMVTEDKYKEKHLVIEPYVDFYDLDRASYQDWTNKLDRSQVLKIKPMSEVNARYYQFKYKQDNDFYNEKYRKQYAEGYGDRIFDNNLEFAKETDSVEVIFSATPLVGYQNEDKIVSTIFKQNNNVEETTEHNIRILQAKKITDVASWKVYNSTTNVFNIPNTLGTYTVYPYAGHLDDPDVPAADINFGATKELYFTLLSGALSNNIFNAYYSPYMAEITDKDSRLLTCKMKLTQQDIFNLDFGRFVYIDGVLYRLTKIKDWSENEICEVELLRVIYTTYNLNL